MQTEIELYLVQTANIITSLIMKEIEPSLSIAFTPDKIDEIKKKILDGIYTGNSLFINGNTNPAAQAYIEFLKASMTTYAAAQLVGETKKLAQAPNWNNLQNIAQSNDATHKQAVSDNTQESPAVKEFKADMSELREALVFDMSSDPIKMAEQLLPIIALAVKSFADSDSMAEFKMHKDKSVTIITAITNKKEILNIIAQPERSIMDWMVAITSPDGKVTDTTVLNSLHKLIT